MEEEGGVVGEVGRRGGMGGGEVGGGVARGDVSRSCLGVGGGNSFISIIMFSSKYNKLAFFYKKINANISNVEQNTLSLFCYSLPFSS